MAKYCREEFYISNKCQYKVVIRNTIGTTLRFQTSPLSRTLGVGRLLINPKSQSR